MLAKLEPKGIPLHVCPVCKWRWNAFDEHPCPKCGSHEP